MTHQNILPTVATDGKACCCTSCGHSLGPATAAWKLSAIRREQTLSKAGGAAYDTGFEGVVLRQFYCPGCAVLLDTETATPNDATLDDRLARRA